VNGAGLEVDDGKEDEDCLEREVVGEGALGMRRRLDLYCAGRAPCTVQGACGGCVIRNEGRQVTRGTNVIPSTPRFPAQDIAKPR